jgi:hypothetical protein
VDGDGDGDGDGGGMGEYQNERPYQSVTQLSASISVKLTLPSSSALSASPRSDRAVNQPHKYHHGGASRQPGARPGG